MYKTFFGLKREPFSVAADPRFLYLSPQHRQAAEHLLYGLQSGAGFILLTGEVGAGKSMVCRAFLRLLPPDADVANVVNPRVEFQALLTRICEELRVEVPEGCLDLIDAIHGHLLLAHAQGRRTLIVVDEAQALSHEVLELLRLLTNLDSTGRKLQIFLIGQPELRATLRLPALEPVSQRIVARFHLDPLPESETARYIEHRLRKAGLVGALPFDAAAMQAVHRICRGIPRRINVLCDRAMLTAKNADTQRIDAAIIERIAPQVFDLGDPQPAAAVPARTGEESGLPSAQKIAEALSSDPAVGPSVDMPSLPGPADTATGGMGAARAESLPTSPPPTSPPPTSPPPTSPPPTPTPEAPMASASSDSPAEPPQSGWTTFTSVVSAAVGCLVVGVVLFELFQSGGWLHAHRSSAKQSVPASRPLPSKSTSPSSSIPGGPQGARPGSEAAGPSSSADSSPGSPSSASPIGAQAAGSSPSGAAATDPSAAAPGTDGSSVGVVTPPGYDTAAKADTTPKSDTAAKADAASKADGSSKPDAAPGQDRAPVATGNLASLIDAGSSSEAVGLRELALLWGERLSNGETCLSRLPHDLRCRQTFGGLDDVRHLDRPSLLSLKRADGSPAFVLLVGFGPRGVLLSARGRTFRISRQALATVWEGGFATLWRGPPGYRPGMRTDAAPMTAWLRDRFAALDPAARDDDDAGLAKRLAEFQIAHGIKPDTIAGPITLMTLNRASGVGEPQLLIER